MNRRALLVRTVTGAVSAAVFTATGWLMGTRSLTMQVNCSCNPVQLCGLSSCSVNCFPPVCTSYLCPSPDCRWYYTDCWDCQNLCGCICYVAHPMNVCGSCGPTCITS